MLAAAKLLQCFDRFGINSHVIRYNPRFNDFLIYVRRRLIYCLPYKYSINFSHEIINL